MQKFSYIRREIRKFESVLNVMLIKNLSKSQFIMTPDNRLIRFDWAMKRMLRHKADHTILEGFLTSLLKQKITIKHFLESESNREESDNKQNRVDILAENDRGEKILIEVQNEAEDAYFHRMLFGTSRLISEYLRKGEDYDKIAKVYSINIVYFNLGEGTDYVYYGRTEFRGLHNGELLDLPRHLQDKYKVDKISDLYPEYYILRADDFDRWSMSPLDQWMYFFSTSTIPASADAPGLPEAREQLRIDGMSPEDRKSYYRYLDNMNSMRNVVNDAVDAAKYYARKEGIEEGIASLVKTMHAKGISPESISRMTNISLCRIEEILT